MSETVIVLDDLLSKTLTLISVLYVPCQCNDTDCLTGHYKHLSQGQSFIRDDQKNRHNKK